MIDFITFIGNQLTAIFVMLYDIKVPLFNNTPLLYVLLFCGVVLTLLADFIMQIVGWGKND